MKRMTAFIAVLALLASMLAGCGGTKEEVAPAQKPGATTIKPGTASIAPAVKETVPAQEPESVPEAQPQSPAPQTGTDYYTVYAQEDGTWGDLYLWAWSETLGDLYEAWPGEPMTREPDGSYSMQIPVEYDYVIVNSGPGEQIGQTEDLYTEGQDLWITYKGSKYDVSYGGFTTVDAAPASENYIAELVGQWEEVYLKDGSLSLYAVAQAYSQTVTNCTEMTVVMEVTMNAGTSCKEWQIWGRSGGTFKKIGVIDLPAGDGYTTGTVTFSSPVTFDAVTITPKSYGSYSYSIDFILTDIYMQ